MGHHSRSSGGYSYKDSPSDGVFERERMAKEKEDKRLAGAHKTLEEFTKGARP